MCGDISLSHLTLLITLTISHINKFPPRVSNSINAPARSIQQPVLRGHTPTGHSRSCARVIKSLTTPSWSGSAARCHSSSRAGLARCSPDLHDAPLVIVPPDRSPGKSLRSDRIRFRPIDLFLHTVIKLRRVIKYCTKEVADFHDLLEQTHASSVFINLIFDYSKRFYVRVGKYLGGSEFWEKLVILRSTCIMHS
jgi:hypothetical protein